MENSNNTLYYVLGAVVLVVVIGAGYLLRPKPATTPAPSAAAPAPPPVPKGPITRLACETQYYNPVIGFPKYYLSVEGVDVTGPTKVDCTMTVSQAGKQVTSEQTSSPVTDKPERNGKTFRCSTSSLDLKPQVPTTVDVALRDDQGAKASCSAVFLLPRP